MSEGPADLVGSRLQALFTAGSCAGMSDAQLLEQFMLGGADAGELAFEVLMSRHGPLVERVCSNMLDDPHDIHDAIQAVFLVLARRSAAIRRRDSIGSWLYGVAVRVAARVRVTAGRRRARQRCAEDAARKSALMSPPTCPERASENERATIVHEEVSRLPERFRAPIVLCYLEGLTHDEAAKRLGWPVGTVRSRLARARATLGPRLARRDVVASVAVWPFIDCLAGNSATASTPITYSSVLSPTPILREATQGLAQAASRLAAGSPLTNSISAASLTLAQGVLSTMILKKLAFAAGALLMVVTAGLAGAAVALQDSPAQDRPPVRKTSAPITKTGPSTDASQPAEVDPLALRLLEAARNRVAAQRAYYEEGRITVDRFIDACRQFELAELLCAKNDNERDAIRKRYLTRLQEIEDREKNELQIGAGRWPTPAKQLIDARKPSSN